MTLNNLKTLSAFKKISLAFLYFLLAGFIVVYFLIFSVINDIKTLRSNIINQKVDLENKIIKEKNLNSLNEKIQKIEPQIEKFNQIFINKNRDLEFITTLEGIAEKNNIDQKIAFDPSKGIAEQGYIKVPINFQLSGDYADFLKYLNDLEILPYYINIVQIDVSDGNANAIRSNGDDLKFKKNINIIMSANTYWK